jgi:hypothetical protein
MIPSTGVVAVWLAQLQLQGPDDFSVLGEFLTHAATVGR